MSDEPKTASSRYQTETRAAPTPVAETAAPLIPDAPWDRAIAAWVSEHLRSSPVSQNTAGWNHLMSAISRLKGFVEVELQRNTEERNVR